MTPFDVLVPAVPDADLGPLLTSLSQAGLPAPVVTPHQTDSRPPAAVELASEPRKGFASPDEVELPTEWELVEERHDQTYRWPEYEETYDRYLVYRGTTKKDATVRIGLGWATRENKWGRDRRYIVAFLSGGVPTNPLAEFLETDDYADTGNFVAVIRGLENTRRMYGPSDSLPQVYVDRFETSMYGQHVHYRGVWNKVVVVAHEHDHETMLNHGLIQGRRRYGL